ncbi:N-acetylmuramoyl-L-alanine amidase [Gynuella sp.]|uniref:N-acetylmuramoyl-L-alanine amidase n=1 Tax=Gynuella sp. TaxID=2969146 RepID=UPI003D1159DF
MRKILLLVASLCFSVLSFATDVEGIRLWKAPDNTRIVFDLSDSVDHKLFTLTNPNRVVVDLKSSNFKASTNDLDLTESGIASIRTGKHGNDGLRIVLDLTSRLTPKSFVLKPNDQYGHRLVIDLGRPDSNQSIEAPGKVKETRSTAELKDSKRNLIIAIDAGHGGEDPGATGRKKTKEKDVVLAIAKELNSLLKAEPGYQPLMIRTGDYYISLTGRRDKARKNHADLFVSIHADAFTNPSARGASVYALSERGATSATAKYLADKENATDVIGGVGGVSLEGKEEVLKSVLVDLSMSATLSSSIALGHGVLRNLGKMTTLHKTSVEQAGFAVLKSPDVPSILVETGFISNPGEEKNLSSRRYRQKIAKAIFHGITTYFRNNPEPGTYVAWVKNQAGRYKKYTVVKGDTLSDIARKNGISIDQIQALNNLKNNNIRIGQILKLPEV